MKCGIKIGIQQMILLAVEALQLKECGTMKKRVYGQFTFSILVCLGFLWSIKIKKVVN